MSTLYLTHDDCLAHTTPAGHPEHTGRLAAINTIVEAAQFADLGHEAAPLARLEDVTRVHPEALVHEISQKVPDEGLEALDADTWLSPRSHDAALRAAGAATRAVDAVMQREVHNVFCAVRPPGHHAGTAKPMGFCLFNSVAIAAFYARDVYDADRVAVVDFDVHHGNGTQEIFWDEADLLYASTHQMPLFPGTGARTETGCGNIFNAPLRAGDGSAHFREAMASVILPAVDAFEPDLIIISAGFDAHTKDPLGGLHLTEEDFAWVSLYLMELAGKHCDDRIVSMLEGGYDLSGLAASAGTHIQALMRGTREQTPAPDSATDLEDY